MYLGYRTSRTSLGLLLLLAGVAADASGIEALEMDWTVDGHTPIRPRTDQLPAVQALEFCGPGNDACVAGATASLLDARHVRSIGECIDLEASLRTDGADMDGIVGHTGLCFEKTRALIAAVAQPHVRTYCETGFNAGHSATAALTANPQVRVLSFDVGQPASSLAVQHLHQRFGPRLELVLGDSRVTLPMYHALHPEVRCDVILVDGGHTEGEALDDLINFKPLARPGGAHVLLLDDTNMPEVAAAGDAPIGLRWEAEQIYSEVCLSFAPPVRGQGMRPLPESCLGITSSMRRGAYSSSSSSSSSSHTTPLR